MHPRNIYRTPPDFKELAITFPEFRALAKQDLSGRVKIDFGNAEAVRVLTSTLLKKDFNLNVEIPPNRLVPTLPLRLNYILWIEDLLSTAADDNRQILGLDVGTGSTCVYPLLASRKNGWKFLATESDAEALSFARKNVEANDLQDKITVLEADQQTVIENVVLGCGRQIDFTMCNPPFFKDEAEARWNGDKCRTASRKPPRGSNSSCSNEAITDGGEVSFVDKMLRESLCLRDRVRFYTTMFGKKQSMCIMKKILSEIAVVEKLSFTTTEFRQGRTMRWAVAWTFLPHLLFFANEEKPSRLLCYVLPKQLSTCSYDVSAVEEQVVEHFRTLEFRSFECQKTEDQFCLRFSASSNTWSHQRRKRRALLQGSVGDSPPEKRACLASEATLASPGSSSLLLDDSERAAVEGLLFCRKVSEEIVLEVQWVNGFLGKDAAQQILQYFKNVLR